MSKENKSNKAEYEKRVLIVLEMLLSGLKRREILEFVRKKDGLNWDVVDSQIDNYIKEANNEINLLSQKNKEEVYKKIKSRLEFLYRKLILVKDYKAALAILDKEAELDGLKVTKLDHTTAGEKINLPVINWVNNKK